MTWVRWRRFIARALHAEEPDWVGAFVGGGITVEEVKEVPAMTSNTVLRVLVLVDEGSKLDAQGINRKLQGAYKDTD